MAEDKETKATGTSAPAGYVSIPEATLKRKLANFSALIDNACTVPENNKYWNTHLVEEWASFKWFIKTEVLDALEKIDFLSARGLDENRKFDF